MKRHKRQSFAYALYELLSSMRFAIGLLTILAIASIIGTVLKQNEPYPNYAFEFGQFWFNVFETLGLYDVYHSSWFLVILSFLVISTSLCIIRNGPGFIREIKTYKEKASDSSLAAMKHSVLLHTEAGYDQAILTHYLHQQGYRARLHTREDGSVLIAAKKGSINKLGYFFAHIALVIICIGGLMDGNLPLKLGEMLGQVVPETRDIPQSQIPAHSRLSTSNLSFRGNVTIPENKSADVIFINSGNGYLVQELPFTVTLKKFYVDYYSNGMPKLFASDIIVTDKATGKITKAQVKVNHPLIIDGIAIYQASFGDGGSPLRLKAWNLDAPTMAPVNITGVSLGTQPFKANGKPYSLEFGELRVFNVESMGDNKANAAKSLSDRMQDAREVKHDNQLKNLGPSITFKLRDQQGQAVEFFQYMSPILQDGQNYQVAGIRTKVSDPFQYLRLPLDDNLSLDTFMRLRAAFMNPALYDEIASQTAAKAMKGDAINPAMQQQFYQSVKWILSRFAQNGFDGLEKFLDERVPADKRQAVAQTYVKILQGAVVDVMEVANRKAGITTPALDGAHYRFLLDSLVGISALHDYQSPVFMQLTGFDQVQASGLQITRSPGKTLVYLGSLLLILGIIVMFYIREIRIWICVRDQELRVAMASNRHNRDVEQDFARHREHIEQLTRGA